MTRGVSLDRLRFIGPRKKHFPRCINCDKLIKKKNGLRCDKCCNIYHGLSARIKVCKDQELKAQHQESMDLLDKPKIKEQRFKEFLSCLGNGPGRVPDE